MATGCCDEAITLSRSGDRTRCGPGLSMNGLGDDRLSGLLAVAIICN